MNTQTPPYIDRHSQIFYPTWVNMIASRIIEGEDDDATVRSSARILAEYIIETHETTVLTNNTLTSAGRSYDR
jgi:hypothetical protein